MSGELFDAPFNLAGESQSSELTAEGEARVRAMAESEARKAQLLLAVIDAVDSGQGVIKQQHDAANGWAEIGL